MTAVEATQQKLDWIDGQMRAKRKWLEDSLKKQWPQHDREMKQRDLEMLEWLQSDYQRVLERQQVAA